MRDGNARSPWRRAAGMGGRVPPRVTYWTGTWDPKREAISKEIEALRSAALGRPPVVSFSTGQDSALDARARVVRLAGAHWPVLRLIAPLVERRGQVSHVFGGFDA